MVISSLVNPTHFTDGQTGSDLLPSPYIYIIKKNYFLINKYNLIIQKINTKLKIFYLQKQNHVLMVKRIDVWQY